jgi:hypothetical protein
MMVLMISIGYEEAILMAVRNCSEIGENLQKIARSLMKNEDLIKYLYFTDKDPLSHENLSDKDKQEKIF